MIERPSMEVETDPGKPLHGNIDEDSLFPDGNGAFLLKGMFFRPIAKALGRRLDGLIPELERPPGRAGWLPFSDYPQRDYTRLSIAAARIRYPHLSDREALRRLARSDVNVFGDSMIGRVMMSVIGDTGRALAELPTVYDKVAPGPWGFDATAEGDRALRITIANHPGEWCYQVGQCEGIAAHYGDRLRTRAVPTEAGVVLHLRW